MIRNFLNSLRPSLSEFRKNDPLRMAGATAFFTTFALPPIIFIIVQLLGLFIDRRNVGRAVISRLTSVLGEDGTSQVRQVLRSIRGFSDSWFVIMTGFIFLLFVATTLFIVIRNSLNQLWKISIRESPGILFQVSTRLRSIGIILFAGLLFMADLLIEGLEAIAGDMIDNIWIGGGVYFRGALNELVSVLIVSIWIIILFRFLADGRPTWKASFIGGLFTGILLTVGKFLLWYLLINSNITFLYGASGSFVLVLLFVFYSSLILYFGASFIYAYSHRNNLPIKPTGKAFAYTQEQV